MRSLFLATFAVIVVATTMTFETKNANALVCAKGVVRAGCVGPNGAVVARRPVAACRWVVVNGVRVRRCY